MRKDQPTDTMIAELLGLQPGQRAVVIHQPRFHSTRLVETLLQRAGEAQPRDPVLSLSLAVLAGWLAPLVFPGAEGEEPAAVVQVRAGNRAGNAHRLLGRWTDAEVCLGVAGRTLALLQGLRPERVTWWCFLGLLRWEQGRLDEAEPLLRQAERCFGELGKASESAAARALLGLLCLERGEPDQAVELFQTGRTALSLTPAYHPWLFVRAGLGLAFCLAESGKGSQARRVFDETLPFYALAGEEEQARLRWLEGKLTARLGRRQEASALLGRAWRLLLADNQLGDAILCFLDLAVVLAERKKGAEVPALLREIEASLGPGAGDPLGEIRRAVGTSAEAIRTASRKARKDVAATAGFTMRRLLRSHGHRVEALPYS